MKKILLLIICITALSCVDECELEKHDVSVVLVIPEQNKVIMHDINLNKNFQIDFKTGELFEYNDIMDLYYQQLYNPIFTWYYCEKCNQYYSLNK